MASRMKLRPKAVSRRPGQAEAYCARVIGKPTSATFKLDHKIRDLRAELEQVRSIEKILAKARR
jgi:hypothetical protein